MAFLLVLGCSDSNGRNCSCPPVDDPVCGVDGVAYASACNAQCAGVGIAHAGACSVDGGGCNCTSVYDPVCGADGHSYGNACLAGCAGTRIVHAGGCGGDGPTGLCSQDSDCVFVPNSNCCGACLARTDTPPPPVPCGAACPATPPPCLCIQGHCGSGTLTQGSPCDPIRDLCGFGLKCCATCCGVPPQGDAGYDPHNECVQPIYNNMGAYCPPVALLNR